MDDFSPEAIADYCQSRRDANTDANPDAAELRWSDQELLQALGGVRLNESAISGSPPLLA